jgi:hypothetical protein
MYQKTFGGRAPPGPAGGAYSAPPDPLAAKKGAASRRGWGGGWGREGGRGGEGGGEGERGRGREGGEGRDRNPGPPQFSDQIDATE